MIPSPIAGDTTSFSIRKGLAPQLETPNPVSYMHNKATSKSKPTAITAATTATITMVTHTTTTAELREGKPSKAE
jgi:hypothetical protein